MFELAAIFGGSFTLGLSGILTPGPILTVTIAESARRGFKAGPLIISGHALLELILVLAIILGLGTYLKSSIVKDKKSNKEKFNVTALVTVE